jgi:hypothetical protein
VIALATDFARAWPPGEYTDIEEIASVLGVGVIWSRVGVDSFSMVYRRIPTRRRRRSKARKSRSKKVEVL